ncbi:hypothetical protein F4818DRAFT_451904 [Hypoxylon cercidicola]|nr:hypothetical protein F4818DRAFT_451904 [Hypoxylon cercidicola]
MSSSEIHKFTLFLYVLILTITFRMLSARQQALLIIEMIIKIIFDKVACRKDIPTYDSPSWAAAFRKANDIVREDFDMPLDYHWNFMRSLFNIIVESFPRIVDLFAYWHQETYENLYCAIFDILGIHHDDSFLRSPGPKVCGIFLTWVDRCMLDIIHKGYPCLPRVQCPHRVSQPKRLVVPPAAIRWNPLEPARVPPTVKTPELSKENEHHQVPETDEEREALVESAISVWRDMSGRARRRVGRRLRSTTEEKPMQGDRACICDILTIPVPPPWYLLAGYKTVKPSADV